MPKKTKHKKMVKQVNKNQSFSIHYQIADTKHRISANQYELFNYKYKELFYKNKFDNELRYIEQDKPNILLYGEDYFQQYYFIHRMLQHIYHINNTILETNIHKVGTKKLSLKNSLYHYEISINEIDLVMIYNIIELIKNITLTKTMDGKLRYIIIYHFDKLPKEIQRSLRSIIEHTYSTTRYVFTCKRVNFVEYAIKSRMNPIRLSCLDNNEITHLLSVICKKENIPIQEKEITYIVNKCGRDISRAVLLLQSSFLTNTYVEVIDDNTQLLHTLVSYIIEFKTLATLQKIRKILLKILEKNVNMETFHKTLLELLTSCKNISDTNKIKMTSIIANAEYRCIRGHYKMIHLEECIYSIINLLHNNSL